MSDHQPHLEPDMVVTKTPPPQHGLSEGAWKAIRTLISERIRKADEATIEVLGTLLGENMAEIDKRLAPLDERLEAIEQRQQHLDDERRKLVLSFREFRQDMREELAVGDS
ncbi:hypothetical protein [Phyllobacterium sp. P5_D12]